MTALTPDAAHDVAPSVIAVASAIAQSGGIAIVGRAAPWWEVSPTHAERFLPHSILNSSPPPLYDGHNVDGRVADTIGDGVYADSSRGGYDGVWRLRDTLAAVDHLFGYLADGFTGLSVEFRPEQFNYSTTAAYTTLRNVQAARLSGVGVVDDPSYPSARILHVVTPDALWTYDALRRRLRTSDDAVGAYLDAGIRAGLAELVGASAGPTTRTADTLDTRRTGKASAARATPDDWDSYPIETASFGLDGMTVRTARGS